MQIIINVALNIIIFSILFQLVINLITILQSLLLLLSLLFLLGYWKYQLMHVRHSTCLYFNRFYYNNHFFYPIFPYIMHTQTNSASKRDAFHHINLSFCASIWRLQLNIEAMEVYHKDIKNYRWMWYLLIIIVTN